MKNKLFPLALAIAGLIVLPSISHAANNQDGFFVNGGVGRSDLNQDPFNDNDTAYNANIGYRWGWFGVEVGYVDPGKFNAAEAVNSVPVSLNAKLHGVTAGVNAHYDFMPNWYVSGRAGAFHWNGSEDVAGLDNGVPIVVSNSDSKTDWYAGVGVGYDFSNNFGIGVDYDHYRATSGNFINLTTGVWSVNAEYRF